MAHFTPPLGRVGAFFNHCLRVDPAVKDQCYPCTPDYQGIGTAISNRRYSIHDMIFTTSDMLFLWPQQQQRLHRYHDTSLEWNSRVSRSNDAARC